MRSPRTTMKSSPHSLHLEKAHVQQRRHNAAKKIRKEGREGGEKKRKEKKRKEKKRKEKGLRAQW